jgi:hypothetical protein
MEYFFKPDFSHPDLTWPDPSHEYGERPTSRSRRVPASKAFELITGAVIQWTGASSEVSPGEGVTPAEGP